MLYVCKSRWCITFSSDSELVNAASLLNFTSSVGSELLFDKLSLCPDFQVYLNKKLTIIFVLHNNNATVEMLLIVNTYFLLLQVNNKRRITSTPLLTVTDTIENKTTYSLRRVRLTKKF